MFKRLSHDLRLVLVSVVASSVVVGVPATAAVYVANADRIDNKHAVAAGVPKPARAGKLVATNRSGVLPNNIIAKAPNADRLDGLDSARFLRANAKATDADRLDGLDSTDLLRSTGKAADADKLDGLDSTAFLPMYGSVSGTGVPFIRRGLATSSRISTGVYRVSFDRDVSTCAHLVTPTESYHIPYTVRGARYAGPATEILVYLANHTGTPVDGGFEVAAIC